MTPFRLVCGYQHQFSVLKVKAEYSSKESVPTTQTKQCHNFEDDDMNIHCHNSSKIIYHLLGSIRTVILCPEY
jgi:hypothetical protein